MEKGKLAKVGASDDSRGFWGREDKKDMKDKSKTGGESPCLHSL
jgi:hypothetical protein